MNPLARLLSLVAELESGRRDGWILRRVNCWIDRQGWIR